MTEVAGKPIARLPAMVLPVSLPLSRKALGVETGTSAFSAMSASEVTAAGVRGDPTSTVMDAAVCTRVSSAGPCRFKRRPPASSGRSRMAVSVPKAMVTSWSGAELNETKVPGARSRVIWETGRGSCGCVGGSGDGGAGDVHRR